MIPLPWYLLRQRWTVCEDIRTAQHSAQRNLKIIIPVVTVYVIIVDMEKSCFIAKRNGRKQFCKNTLTMRL